MPWTGESLLARAQRLWASRKPREALVAEDVPSAVTPEECRRLAELARDRRVLEVGSYLGRSTIALASTAAVVHTVDLHPPDDLGLGLRSTVGALIENLERYDVRHRVVVHVGFSQLVLPELPAASFDVAFLDGQHQRDPVEEDLAALLPLLRPGGVLALHDYGVPGVEHEGRWDPFAVTEVVDELAAERGLDVEVTGTLAVLRLP
ncbi:MAG TPA: class I SAM-dependent methyltransferase [Gaiellaceae bacterium]|nr:class I SAM-dependent methyltransferase [Gaiellaceae bacterium]